MSRRRNFLLKRNGNGVPRAGLLAYFREIGGTMVDTIGLSTADYADVDEPLKAIFFVDENTLRPVQDACDLAVASPYFNIGWYLAGDMSKATLALYSDGTQDSTLIRAHRYFKHLSLLRYNLTHELPENSNFSRSTVASISDAWGATVDVPIGVPAFDSMIYPVNHLKSSGDLTGSSWVSWGGLVKNGNVINATAGGQAITQAISAPGTDVVFSITVKKGTLDAVQFLIRNETTASTVITHSFKLPSDGSETTLSIRANTGISVSDSLRLYIYPGENTGDGSIEYVSGSFNVVADQDNYKWPLGYAQTTNTSIATGYASGLPRNGLTAWGDSLTYCINPALLDPYTAQMTATLPNIQARAFGVGGESSAEIKTRFLAATEYHDDTVVIWAGRNDFGSPPYGDTKLAIKQNIADMISALSHDRYIVMSVLNDISEHPEATGDSYDRYIGILELNQELASEYPGNYVDIRQKLVDEAQSSIYDTVDESLRSDGLHLNRAGYGVVARELSSFISAKKWVDTVDELPAGSGIKISVDDNLSAPCVANVNDIIGTITWTPDADSQGLIWLIGSYVDSANYFGVRCTVAGNIEFVKRVGGSEIVASLAFNYSAGNAYTIKFVQNSTSGMALIVDGSNATNPDTNNLVLAESLQVGADGNGANKASGYFKNISFLTD